MAVWKGGFYTANNPAEFKTYEHYGSKEEKENLIKNGTAIKYISNSGRVKYILLKLP